MPSGYCLPNLLVIIFSQTFEKEAIFMKIVDSLPLFGLSQFFSRMLFFIALKNFVITRFFKGSYLEDQHLELTENIQHANV